MEDDHARHIVRVYVGSLSQEYEALSVEASKHTTAEEIVQCIVQKLGFNNPNDYELAEVIGNSTGQECKERRIGPYESPVALKLLWPKASEAADSLLFTNTTPGVPAASAAPTTTRTTAASSSAPGSLSNSHFSASSFTNNFPSPGTSTASRGAGNGKGYLNGSNANEVHNRESHGNSTTSDVSSLITDQYRFCLRERLTDSLIWSESFVMDPQIIRDYFYRFLYQHKDKEYPDLCQLPDLNEFTLSENLKSRFNAGHIYTYVGSILIAINPFRFHPIYNPKYVKLYQNRRREELPPHIFAIADSAYHTMLKEKRNQCIVISGESGSGKTESTNFLLHHLTALSQKGSHGSGVEQTILSAGPVLEAFGNAKTAHNNNSSRFGKFIQVSYRENGMVHGAIVQKYLLEKSRICCQAKNERNYHVFYYLLAGASDNERGILNLLPPHKYHYLNQSECTTLDGVDESYEFSRLKQSMEMVGFGPDTQRKLFCVLSAVLLIGNVEFTPKKSSYHHDESVLIQNPAVVRQISHLLRVTEDTLLAALTSKRARVSGEMLVINYRMPEAIAARDAMAKCLYETLFDWIVLQVNHSLLSKKDSSADYNGNSIGVLDIFGFEDFGDCNSFEQFCINYANEHLQHYFNQHVFKYEQEEYKKEGIHWTNIDFMDNTPCLSLTEGKPNGLICILDDQCSFPGATNETLLQKFNSVHKDHEFYLTPQRREAAFIIRHYAGKVKYQVSEFREKNMDLMRHDIVSVLKNSSSAFVRELVGLDPVAVFRWAILRAFFRAYFSFHEAGFRHRKAKVRSSLSRAYSSPARRRSSNDHLINNPESEAASDFDVIRNIDHDHSNISSGSIVVNMSVDCGAIGVDGGNTMTRNEQIIRCQLMKTRNRSSLQPYPSACSNRSLLPTAFSTISYNDPLDYPRALQQPPPPSSMGDQGEREDEKFYVSHHFWNGDAEEEEDSGNIHLALLCRHCKNPVKYYADGPCKASRSYYFCHNCKNACSPTPVSDVDAKGYHVDNPFVVVEHENNKKNAKIDPQQRKNRSFRVQPTMSRGMKNLQSVKILASQTAVMGVSSKNVNPRKQPLSVSQQFQQSLHSLMITLNQANPFFIRCIKSNSDKTPSKFDDDIVQRQLRYTGMLETVRIRQAGYNVRLTFDEFIHLYRILLPKGLQSNKYDVHKFLVSLNLNPLNYQLGSSKIFLREIEKIKLDYVLHQRIMASIVRIQRWYRAVLERRQFLKMHDAVLKLQSYMRMHLAQKFVANLRIRHLAATFIQKIWRGYATRKWFDGFKQTCIQFQSRVRGVLVRRQYQRMVEEHRRLSKQKEKLQVALRVKTDGDTNSGQSDEAFLSKGSSQEELEEHKLKSLEFEDSEESSGVHEDSEPESAVLDHLVQSLKNAGAELPPVLSSASSSSMSTATAVSMGNIANTTTAPSIARAFQQMPSLSESMPALTLALSASPFSLPLGESVSLSQPLTRRSPSPLPDDASHVEPPVVKERTKKKMSLKSRKDKGYGKVVEDETAMMRDVDAYRDESEGRRDDGTSKNPFHRAKKHIKTLITGNSKQKLEKHEAVLLDSGSEAEEGELATNSRKSNSNSSSTQSTVTHSENYIEPASFESLIFDQRTRDSAMEKLSSPTSGSMHKLRRESSGGSSDQGGAGDFMSMPNEHIPFGSRMEDYLPSKRGKSQKENVPIHPQNKRKGSDSVEHSRKSSVSSSEQQHISLRTRDSRSHYSSGGGRNSEDIENVRRWANSTSSYEGSGDSREPSVRESVRNLIGMFADLNTRQPPHLPLKTFNSSAAVPTQPGSTSPTQEGATTSPNKAGRTSSIPSLGTGREIRRTRSVSETRQPVHSRREFSLEPSPYVSADFVSADVNPSAEEVMLSSGHPVTPGPKTKTGYHMLEKVTKFHRGETCGACRKNMHSLFAPGVKCTACKSTFHSKCMQNGMIQGVPCRNNRPIMMFSSLNDECMNNPLGSSGEKLTNTRRKPKPRKQKTDGDVTSTSSSTKAGKFNLTKTSEFTDRTDQIISGVKELKQMQEFISNKIYQVSKLGGKSKESRIDRVFEQALREFKESLVSTYSVASKQGDSMPLNIRYKDLIANFTNIMETVSKHESIGTDSATTMGVNAFRGFLNEFMNTTRTTEEKPVKATKQRKRPKEKGGKRQKVEDTINHLGHSFVPMVINIPTACEICSSFIMWPIERGVVCQKCKMAAHKKCHLKIFSECNEGNDRHGGIGDSSATGIFGAPLGSLISDGATIPYVVEQLIMAIELYGLRMEGLYRKSGVSSRVKELKLDIEDGKPIDCELYAVHVLTSVLKSFFREMPEPLLTFELYDEFLRAAQLSQQEDRINTLFALLKKLPKPNYDLMERLVFHLVRVSLCEDKNRMNANSLAIVFAPCILRTNKNRQVQESLNDIGMQTTCLETIIMEQMKKVKETLNNIESVDSAKHSFSVRLNSIRSSKMQLKTSPMKSIGSSGSLSETSGDIKLIHESSTPESMSAEEEEEYLTQHIKHLQDEKAMLTSVLPSLSRTPSDEDMLSTDEVDSPGGSVDDLHQGNTSPSPRTVRAQSLQYSRSESLVSESLQVTGVTSARGTGGTGGSLLHNLIKNRGPIRKPPSRFVRNLASVDFGEKESRILQHYRTHQQHHYVSSTSSSTLSTNHEHSSGPSGNGTVGNNQTPQEEDESVISMDQSNDEEAILV